MGCMSVPIVIAQKALDTSQNCMEAAQKTEICLRVLNYSPKICTGPWKPGGKYHAWIEYSDSYGVIVLDPSALTGTIEVYREDLSPGYYLMKDKISLSTITREK